MTRASRKLGKESRMPGAVGAGVAIAVIGYGLARAYRWLGENIEAEAIGYEQGSPFRLSVVSIDGKPVETDTARAFKAMRRYARLDRGISLRVVSGFRTNDEQKHFYNCYSTCSCNDCHFAEPPGYSKHQNGRALDLNTREAGVLEFLREKGGWFGFVESVTGEPWHWEYNPALDLTPREGG